MSEAVREMFSAIAWRYDLANRVISLGQDQRWRRALADAAIDGTLAANPVGPGQSPMVSFLDCACGTGDVAFMLQKRLGVRQLRGTVHATDFSREMLDLAQFKYRRIIAGCPEADIPALAQRGIALEQADILALPFPDASFDACTIAFGVRNLDDPRAGLREMARVLRTGAPLCILETGRPPSALLTMLHRAWSRIGVPLLGGLISGNLKAYSYLNRTSASFPSGREFVAIMEDCGVFSRVTARPLSGGVVWLYVGTVSGPADANLTV